MGRQSASEIHLVKVDAQTVASLLREYAQRTALRGGNPYRANASSRAVDSLGALALPLDQLIAEGRLTDIPGVGDAICISSQLRSNRLPEPHVRLRSPCNKTARIDELCALKAMLQSLLDNIGFYARNPAKFAEVSAAFAKESARCSSLLF
jgi:hypothetical protein